MMSETEKLLRLLLKEQSLDRSQVFIPYFNDDSDFGDCVYLDGRIDVKKLANQIDELYIRKGECASQQI